MPSTKKLLQAAAGSAGGDPLYAEDVFSTYLYDGNSSTNVITNGIDLAGEGGLVWGKSRDNAFSHMLIDTVRGGDKGLSSNASSAEYDNNTMITSFNSNGFTLGSYLGLNYNGDDVASWTFRKAEKFFDVVTYTGNGTAGRTVAHNLGSVPGMIVVKKTSGSAQWPVYHGSRGIGKELFLNKTDAETAYGDLWSGVTSTNFTVSNNNQVNNNGDTYVAYLFASDAGGFGDDSDENIIKCGSYTGNGSIDGPTVTLGFEPQWIMIKGASVSSDWTIFDIMRGLPVGENDTRLWANGAFTENNTQKFIDVQATGFKLQGQTSTASNGSGSTYIYMAIRRPMKTPESGTEVFAIDTYGSTGDGLQPAFRSTFPVDMALRVDTSEASHEISSRLTQGKWMYTDLTNAEASQSLAQFGYQNGWFADTSTASTYYSWMFKRATGFMDVVCYNGDGASGRQITHNLAANVGMLIVKKRSGSQDWWVWHSGLNANGLLRLNTNSADNGSDGKYVFGNGTTAINPTSSVFTVQGTSGDTSNTSGATYIAYLFATLAGVSKVGSYTGTGSNVDVDCGFSAGARFILIKRTDATGDWYVYDSLRGISAGNDPYLLLNSSAAQVTNTDYVDPLSSGFTVTSSAPAALNASGGNYIFLAIA